MSQVTAVFQKKQKYNYKYFLNGSTFKPCWRSGTDVPFASDKSGVRIQEAVKFSAAINC